MSVALYVVDARVEGLCSICDALPKDAEVLVLDADHDGLEQIAVFLADHESAASLHILSHGAAGSVLLGSTVLNQDTIALHADVLARIGLGLTSDGDILLYGCNVAEGEVGQAFISTLAALTGADVAASTGVTGAGGNWVLESLVGDVAMHDVLLDLEGHEGSLAMITGSTGNDSLVGTASADYIDGGVGNDTLVGNAGSDTLNGGLGADSMTGGRGNDVYMVDNVGDKVVEQEWQGMDTVQSFRTWTLGANLENLLLMGSAAIGGTGNGEDNRLTGNGADNRLTGNGGNDFLVGNGGYDTLLGGVGNDTLNGGTGGDPLVGGLGNDVYFVDNADDQVIELSGQGVDSVQASRTWVLSDNVERLVLTGVTATNGTGNGINNRLTGNRAANRLSGNAGNDTLVGNAGNDTLNGGVGVDSMTGGLGNDVYVVDNVGDKIIEIAGQGTDTVQSSRTWTLGSNLENLFLTGVANIRGTGNALNNRINGNSGANELNGLAGDDVLAGGAGNDTLFGGMGNDTIYGGTGDDICNVAEAAFVAADDFTMNVDMGAGDDILVINVPFARNVSVAGGAGANTIKVSHSHGTNAATTFKAFSGFQTYEIEGNVAATSHDFTSMAGISDVIIATTEGVSTQLIDLEAAQNVTVSGKKQTIGTNSTANQLFNVIRLTNDTGATRVVTLDNTARLANTNVAGALLDGRLIINQLLIDATPTGVSATRSLEIASDGERNTANIINDIDAALVNTFRLTGTQDLTATITAAANSTAAAASRANLVVNAATLTGDLDLSIDGGVVSAADAGTASRVRLTGATGAADRLTFDESNANNTLAITTDTTVAGLETVRFVQGNGVVDATNFSGVGTYDIEDLDGALTLDSLKGTEVINVNIDAAGAVAGNAMTFIAGGQSASSVLDLEFRDNDTVQVDNNTAFAVAEISARDYRTVSLDLGGYATQNEAYSFQLELQDGNGDDADVVVAPAVLVDGTGVYDAASVYARSLVVSGGGDQGNAGAAGGVDSLNLGTVSNVLSSIDLSDYVGQVAMIIYNYADNVVDRNVTIKLNGYGANLSEFIGFVDESVVTYAFATDAVANTEDVTIVGFLGFNVLGATLSNMSVLDLSRLGVEGLADLKLTDADVDGDGFVDDICITSNEGLNFQIDLVGVTMSDLSNENFRFAV